MPNVIIIRSTDGRWTTTIVWSASLRAFDDVRVSNPPVNGPLLDALSKRLVDSDFSLRLLVGDICNSRVYQLSARPKESNKLDQRQFSHAKLRRMRADVLMASVVTVTNFPRGFSGFPDATRAIELVVSGQSSESVIDSLYVLALSRRATEQEKSSMTTLVGESPTDVAVYEDILWGLINSTEFIFNH